MDSAVIMTLVKERLGIRSNVRDAYIEAIVNGVVKEMEEEKGLVLDSTNSYHLMFIVDYSAWRYQNVNDTSKEVMPRHLQYRLHNLILKQGAIR